MKQHRKLVALFALLSMVYVALILVIPSDARALNRYQLSGTEAKLIALSFAIPYVVIWFSALLGYIKLKGYSILIKASGEGSAFSMIADGLLLLALWMPISAISTNIATYTSQNNSDLLPTLTIINNYVTIALILAAFVLIHRGARKLKSVLRTYGKKLNYQDFFPEIFVLASGLFVYLTFTNAARTTATETAPIATYYLPDMLILLTIVVPYIFIWFLGLNAARHVQAFRLGVAGTLYQDALKNLARGILVVLMSLIALRYLTSVSALFDSGALKLILLFAYMLLIVIALGYSLIALGAHRLKKIEEV